MPRVLKEEEEQIRADLQESETYHASDDGNESSGEKQGKAIVYGWEDFFTD